uniref:Leucine Rich repeats (2 copies) n=1 Tax=Steinernema glaseri TaxID=37863 RepID=A0A1I7ZNY3_9BILA
MIKNYQQMAEWDPKRKMVYRYKASVLTIRKALLVDKHVAEPEKTQLAAILDGRGDLDLHGRELTDASALKPLSGLITHLDLRRTGMDIGQIQWMSALEHVDFGQNPIEKIPSGLQLPYLTFLSLANTKVRSIDDVKPVNQLKKLERLLVCETELAESHTKELYDFVGSLRGEGETAIRLITHWL